MIKKPSKTKQRTLEEYERIEANTPEPRYRYVHGILCPRCDEKIWSRYGHDFRSCGCGYCFIDGGQSEYRRIGYGVRLPEGMENDGTVPKRVWNAMKRENERIGMPKSIRMRVPAEELDKYKPRSRG